MFNYENFIEYLKNLYDTEEVLIALYNYFKDNVKYDYDLLQYYRIIRARKEGYEKIYKIIENYPSMNSYNEVNFDEKIKEINLEEEKENVIKILNDAFLELENRPLSDNVKKILFKEWGKIELVSPNPTNPNSKIVKLGGEKPYKRLLFFGNNMFSPQTAFPPQYKEGLLKKGVCANYADWIQKICKDLNIPCYEVVGKGTAAHHWNLIYIKEQDRWVHFDMTCVRFYLDNFNKNFGEPDKWVFASTETIFRMQPKREIHSVNDIEGNVIFEGKITKENYNEFEDFEMNELWDKLGRSK